MNTTMFWSCTGINASELSFGTAQRISAQERTLLVELPCLGIPRLGFVCGIMDRGKNTDAAIMHYEQSHSLFWDMAHHINKKLSVLPANVYAVPDIPVVSKVSVNTLIAFVPALQRLAEGMECGRLVLDCQGQLYNPMTFFSIRAANQIVIPLGKATDAAYALASIQRLVQTYAQKPDKFILAAAGNVRSIKGTLKARNKGSEALEGVAVTPWDSKKAKAMLTKTQRAPKAEDRRGKGVILPFQDAAHRRDAKAEALVPQADLQRVSIYARAPWKEEGAREMQIGESVYL